MSKKIFFGMIVIFLTVSVYYGLKDPKSTDTEGVVAVDFVVAGNSFGIADEGDKIIKIISTLSTVKLNTEFFQEKDFLSLKDLSVYLVEGSMGKINPFANY